MIWLFQQSPNTSRLTGNSYPQVGQGGAPPTKEPIQTNSNSVEIKMFLIEGSPVRQLGKAFIEEIDGVLRVRVELNNPTGIAVSQPAHLHMGECPGVGRIAYSLNNVVNGQSETILNLTLDQLKSQLPLALNVHKSAEEMNVYTACGNIPF